LQTPTVGAKTPSSSSHSWSSMRPSNRSGPKVQMSDVTMERPWKKLQLRGPAVSMMAGLPALAAPINCAGTVLSQPASSTTPSTGLHRIISSTSIAIRLRSSIVVGLIMFSCNEMVGNTTAVPPAAVTPAFTDSAKSRNPPLQGLSSL